MQAITNSSLVWKRRADENEQSAKLLTRISVALLLLMVAMGGYGYSQQTRVAQLCSSLQAKIDVAQSVSARKLGFDIASAYCR